MLLLFPAAWPLLQFTWLNALADAIIRIVFRQCGVRHVNMSMGLALAASNEIEAHDNVFMTSLPRMF